MFADLLTRACRYELGLALAEACLERREMQCKLVSFSVPGNVSDKAPGPDPRIAAEEVVRSRQLHHSVVARPVSPEFVAWVQGALLMLLGVIINALLGREW
jgi:hypothetical protein